MPQTREHLAILDLLEVGHGVVALTKRDLVDDDGAALAREDAAEALASTRLAAAEIVEVSARTGVGLDALRDALRRAAGAGTRRPRLGSHPPAGRPRVLAARHRHRRHRHAVGRLDRGRRPRDRSCRSASTGACVRSRRTTATSPGRSTAAASRPAWSASNAATSPAARRSSPGRCRRPPTAWTSSCIPSRARRRSPTATTSKSSTARRRPTPASCCSTAPRSPSCAWSNRSPRSAATAWCCGRCPARRRSPAA